MAKKFVTAVFDRRKEVEKKGTGNVEILIYVSLKCRKLIPMKRGHLRSGWRIKTARN